MIAVRICCVLFPSYQLNFAVKYATLICKLCKHLHKYLRRKTAEANNCNSFKYLLQRLQTKFAAFKICSPGCTLDANICSVPHFVYISPTPHPPQLVNVNCERSLVNLDLHLV